MKSPTRKPCNECPMRRKSTPGYTGAATPDELVDSMGGHGLFRPANAMPCHTTVDYTDPKWEMSLDAPRTKVRQCAGQAIYLANICKRPRPDETAKVGEPDHVLVFSSRTQFIDHHVPKTSPRR